MIVFRNTNSRYPFLWESSFQPAARYHAENDGPAQYFADTADGAWAEFVRNAEITDPEELLDMRRSLWCVEIPDDSYEMVQLPYATATGNKSSYNDCQNYAKSLREKKVLRLKAPSAAIINDQAGGWRVQDGLQRGIPRAAHIFVIFELMPNVPGWRAAIGGPPVEILEITHHF